MTTKIRTLRGPTAKVTQYVGEAGQIVIDTDTNHIYIHDGVTIGGKALGVTLDRYDVKLQALAANNIDLSVAQVFTFTMTASRTLTFSNEPASNRAMTLVLIISGNTGSITWPGNVTWNASTAPVLGATNTVVTLVWKGNGWIGIVGASI